MHMNKVPWHQQLKEKRLAYGVSQNKLALHVVRSRQYSSRIETGKRTTTQTLQQGMFDFVEQVNPESPLETLFDYVRIRFLRTYPNAVIEAILRLKMEYMIYED